jgi:hypothetical protein
MSDSPDAPPGGLDQCNNPYDEETHPNAHDAYREGWEARRAERPHTANPYETEGWTVQRAWINGWQAAHLRFAQQPPSS